jgi:ATP-binding cassette subfamily F protein uup
LGLDGRGNAASFADYSQWEQWMRQAGAEEQAPKAAQRTADPSPGTGKKKLSYLEAREYATIEQRVEEADERVRAAHAAIEDPNVTTDAAALTGALKELEEAQAEADALYHRWAELTEKAG